MAIVSLALSAFAIAQNLHGSGYIAAFTGGMLFGFLAKENTHEMLIAAEVDGEVLARRLHRETSRKLELVCVSPQLPTLTIERKPCHPAPCSAWRYDQIQPATVCMTSSCCFLNDSWRESLFDVRPGIISCSDRMTRSGPWG